MKAIEITGPGAADQVRYAERDEPLPGAGQLTVQVEYAGLNFVDVLARRGVPGYSTGWPFVPGMEVGGRVRAVGDGVTALTPGDRVVAFTVDGTGLADVALAEAALCVRVPESLDLAAATAIPLSWATALGLFRLSHAVAGDRVLVTSASGAVGVALARLMTLHGVTALVGGTGSSEKTSSLAAEYTPAVRGDDFYRRALALAKTEGFDVILESVGGDYLASAVAATRAGGRIVSYGAAAGEADPETPAFRELRTRNLTLSGFSIINRARTIPQDVARLMTDVIELAEAGLELGSPRVIGWDQGIDAHISQGDGRGVGKTVVRL